MPDPFNEMQGEIKKPGLVARLTGAASAAQQAFENPQAYQAMGAQMEETLSTLAKQIAASVGEEISKFTADFTKGIEQQMSAFTEAVKKMSKETSEELGRNTETLVERAGRYSEQSIQNMLERYERMEKAAMVSKQSLDELLPQLENNPGLKKVMAMMNFQVSDDPTTGRLMFQVGDKKVPLEEITTEQISQVARTGHLTETPPPPDYGKMVGKVQGGIQQVTGIVMPVMAPVEQMIQTIAPTSLEQVQMGMGMAGGAAQGIGGMGMGLSMLSGTAGAVGSVLGPVGMIASAALSIATPLIEGYLKRKYESQERTVRFGAVGQGYEYGVQAENVYAALGGKFFPYVSKEEMSGLIEGFSKLGTATDELSVQVARGGGIMKNFNLSTQQVLQMSELQMYGGVGGAGAISSNLGVLQAEAAAAGGRSGVQFFPGIQQTMFYAGFGAENDPDFLNVVTIVTSEVNKWNVPAADVEKLVSAIFSSGWKIPCFGTQRMDTLSAGQVLTKLRAFILRMTDGGNTRGKSQGWVDAHTSMFGGIASSSLDALADWAKGVSSGQLEQTATESSKELRTTQEINAFLEQVGGGKNEGRDKAVAEGLENVPGRGGWADAERWFNDLTPEMHARFAAITDEQFEKLEGNPDDADTPRGRVALWRRKNYEHQIPYSEREKIWTPGSTGQMGTPYRILTGEGKGLYERSIAMAREQYGTPESILLGGKTLEDIYKVEVTVGFKEDSLSQLLEQIEEAANTRGVQQGEGQAGKKPVVSGFGNPNL